MILFGDCLERMKELEDNSVDSVVTDPPYGWRFMGKAWDGADIEKVAKAKERGGVMADGRSRKPRDLPAESAGTYDQTIKGNHAFEVWTHEYAKELFRVLKPGGHMLIFCGPRTYHRMASGLEDAGFEIRDQLQWLFGSGFPKSHNIGNGIGTALKPANEPIVLARKPLEKGLTVAANVLKWGVGGLNIDASRISSKNNEHFRATVKGRTLGMTASDDRTDAGKGMFSEGSEFEPSNNPQGRWPANLILDEAAAELLDEQSGHLHGAGNKSTRDEHSESDSIFGMGGGAPTKLYDHGGGASRFFYVAKASKRERNAGLEGMQAKLTGNMHEINIPMTGVHGQTGKPNKPMAPQQNFHPTVKPIKLMEYLIKLITPPNGTVLDPFMGSGSTGVAAFKNGFKFIGIEMNAEYVEIATKRIASVNDRNQDQTPA